MVYITFERKNGHLYIQTKAFQAKGTYICTFVLPPGECGDRIPRAINLPDDTTGEREGRPRSPIASVIQCRPNIKNMPSYRRRGRRRRPPLRKPIKRILSAEQCARRREGGRGRSSASFSLARLVAVFAATDAVKEKRVLSSSLPPSLPHSLDLLLLRRNGGAEGRGGGEL